MNYYGYRYQTYDTAKSTCRKQTLAKAVKDPVLNIELLRTLKLIIQHLQLHILMAFRSKQVINDDELEEPSASNVTAEGMTGVMKYVAVSRLRGFKHEIKNNLM
jgi:hypothetical protein